LDMVPAAHKRFGKAVKSFVEKLREAQAIEIEMAKLREEVRREFDEIGSLCPIEQWEPALLLDITRADLRHPLINFIDRMKSHGYDV